MGFWSSATQERTLWFDPYKAHPSRTLSRAFFYRFSLSVWIYCPFSHLYEACKPPSILNMDDDDEIVTRFELRGSGFVMTTREKEKKEGLKWESVNNMTSFVPTTPEYVFRTTGVHLTKRPTTQQNSTNKANASSFKSVVLLSWNVFPSEQKRNEGEKRKLYGAQQSITVFVPRKKSSRPLYYWRLAALRFIERTKLNFSPWTCLSFHKQDCGAVFLTYYQTRLFWFCIWFPGEEFKVDLLCEEIIFSALKKVGHSLWRGGWNTRREEERRGEERTHHW